MGYTELSASYPRGRKDYRCEWCAEKIPKGEKHFYRAYHWEGDFSTGRMHLECEKAMEKSLDAGEGWMPGEPARGVTLEGVKIVQDPATGEWSDKLYVSAV